MIKLQPSQQRELQSTQLFTHLPPSLLVVLWATGQGPKEEKHGSRKQEKNWMRSWFKAPEILGWGRNVPTGHQTETYSQLKKLEGLQMEIVEVLDWPCQNSEMKSLWNALKITDYRHSNKTV